VDILIFSSWWYSTAFLTVKKEKGYFYFNPSLVAIVAAQCLPYGKQISPYFLLEAGTGNLRRSEESL